MNLLRRSLQSLDDDCMLEILARGDVGVEEMVEIASTCTRFQRVAQQIFSSKFVQMNHWEKMENWPMERVERYFQYFGKNCRSFDVNFTAKPDTVLRLLNKHCKNLVNLRCSGYGNIGFIELRQLFQRLVQYEQTFGLFVALCLFGEESPLEKLALNNCTAYFPEQRIPKLQHLKLNSVELNKENVSKFCELNPQIIRLELHDPCSSTRLSDFVYLVNLEEFSYITDLQLDKSRQSLFVCSVFLRQLRTLRVRASNSSIFCLLDGLMFGKAPLESLSLEIEELHRSVIPKICEYKSIKRLHLKKTSTARTFEQNKLMELVNNMPQLEHIHCDTIKLEDVLVVLRDSRRLQSAFFTVRIANLECDSTIITDISKMSKFRNIQVSIEVLSYGIVVS